MFSLYSNDLLKYKNCVIKIMLPERFRFIKKNYIYNEKNLFNLFIEKNLELSQN